MVGCRVIVMKITFKSIVLLSILLSSSVFAQQYNLKDPALNKCFSEMLGKEKYQQVIFTETQKPNQEELNSITECLNNPDYWRFKTYDIFASNKVENCISNPNPVFTHEVTNYSKISKIERWGQIKRVIPESGV